MKMTTEIKQHYFEFSPDNGSDYYALIAAKDKAEAIEVYLRDVSDPDMESEVNCKELSTPAAWQKCCACDDVEGELSIEDRLEQFEESGVILYPLELIQ